MQPQTTTAAEHAIAVKNASRHLRPVVLEMRRRLSLLADRVPDLRQRLTSSSFWRLADGLLIPLHEFVNRYQALLHRLKRPGGITCRELLAEGAAMKGRASLLWVGFELFARELEAAGLAWA